MGNTKIASGYMFILAISNAGFLYSWGQNNYGQLGNGASSTTNVLTPTKIGTKKWVSISGGGGHSLAIDADGYLYSWGQNNYGQLGNGASSTTNVLTPTKIGTKKWLSVAAGVSHILAIDTDGFLYSWGVGDSGQLGNGVISSNKITTPTKIGTKKWLSVAAGASHTLAIDTDGFLYSWGQNSTGQLGNNDTTNLSTPTKIGTKKWVSISGGGGHSLAIDADGYLYSWGRNNVGQLGNGASSTTNVLTPTKIGTKKWVSVAAGQIHSAVLSDEKIVYTFGYNFKGQLGETGSFDTSLTEVLSLDGALTFLYLFALQNNAYTVANGLLKELGTIDLATLADTFKNDGLTEITAQDLQVVGQSLGRAKIIKMDV